jgi:hydrogenase nickel incorporation protein HypA/HybF
MHELSIMTYLLEAVEEQAQQLGASKVRSINLVMGERAGMDDSLLFYFDLLTPGTLAEGAQLHIRRTTMRFHCEPCDSEYSPALSRGDFSCPRCGSVGRLTDDGSNLLIESIEIET